MANATTETKLEPLDFIAPRDAVVERTTPPGASMPWMPVRLRRGDQVEFRASNDWTLRGWEIPGADVPRVHAELVALRDGKRDAEGLDFIAPRDLTLAWNGGTPHPPIRTGQPEAVRARKAARVLENTKVATMPGATLKSAAAAKAMVGRVLNDAEAVDGMAASRLRDQLASGGVDCPETRAANVARVKDEARVVGEMQDAVRVVASWPVKRKRCDVCKGATEALYLGTCIYCARKNGMGCRESGPGIAIDRTPGPHEGACAWASATWGEL